MGVLDFLQPRTNNAALLDDPLAAIKASLFKYSQPDAPLTPPVPDGVQLAPSPDILPPRAAGPAPGVQIDASPPSLTIPAPAKTGLLDKLLPDDSATGGLTRAQKLAMLGATLQDVGAGLGGEKGGNVLATQKLFRDRQEQELQRSLGTDLARAFQGSGAGPAATVGGPGAATAGAPAPISAPAIAGMTPATSAVTAPTAATAPRSRGMPDVRAIYGTIAKGLMAGKDMTPYLNLTDKALPALSRQAWLDTLPPEDQAAAAQDPAGYLAWVRPKIEATSGPIQSVNPRTGVVTTLKEADPKGPDFGWQADPNHPGALIPTPGGPADPSYIHTTAKDRALGGREGAPPQFVVYGPSWEHRADPTGGAPSTTRVVGQVADKVRTQGVDSLTPGEKAIWDRYVEGTKNNPLAALAALFGGGDGSGIGGPGPAGPPTPPAAAGPRSAAPAPAATPAPAAPRPQPRPMPQAAAPAPSVQPARVQSKADLDRLPKGAPYINPSDGRVLYKKY